MTLCESPGSSTPGTPARQLRAEAAHKIWAHWMQYFFSVCYFIDGRFVVPEEHANRWMRQSLTAFNRLSDAEKKSDYDIADKFLIFTSDGPLEFEEIAYLKEIANDITEISPVSGSNGYWFVNIHTGFPQNCVKNLGPYSAGQAIRVMGRLREIIVLATFGARIDKIISRDTAFAAQDTQPTEVAAQPATSPVAPPDVLDDTVNPGQWPSYFPDKNTITGIERRRIDANVWEVEIRGTDGFEHYFQSLNETSAKVYYDTLLKLVAAETDNNVLASVRYQKSADGCRFTAFFDWGAKYALSAPLSGTMRCSLFMGARRDEGWVVLIEAVIDSRTILQRFVFSGARYDAAAYLFDKFSTEICSYWESQKIGYFTSRITTAPPHSVYRSDYTAADTPPTHIYAQYGPSV